MSAIRSGYKQTEVGVIPEDWETSSMLGISRQIMDYRGRTPKKLGMDWGGGDIPALSAANVKMGFIDFHEECYFGSEALYRRWMTKGDVAKGDVLFTTEAPLGNVALVPDDRKYILSQRTILLQVVKQRVSNRFLFQVMRSDGFQRMLADYSSGSTAKGIQRKKFEQLSVALPPLIEQEAIAEALSDTDALIESLEQLVAKKRHLKQGTMQELLTGKKRLPGFSGKWDSARLDEVGSWKGGMTPSMQNPAYWQGGTVPWISSGDVKSVRLAATGFSITDYAIKQGAATLIPANSIVVVTRSGILRKYLPVAMNMLPMAINQDIKALVPSSRIDASY